MCNNKSGKTPMTILAISSGGGHWKQLLRLCPAFDKHKVVYATTKKSKSIEVINSSFYLVPDGNRWKKMQLIWMAVRVLIVIVRVHPSVVISTGAAPGFFGIIFGKLFGSRTIWIDSIANSQKLSLCGQKVKRFADLYLTQWPNLARPEGPYYRGSVL